MSEQVPLLSSFSPLSPLSSVSLSSHVSAAAASLFPAPQDYARRAQYKKMCLRCSPSRSFGRMGGWLDVAYSLLARMLIPGRWMETQAITDEAQCQLAEALATWEGHGVVEMGAAGAVAGRGVSRAPRC